MIKDLTRFILFVGLVPFTVFNITTAAHAGESKEGQNSAVKSFRDCVAVCPEMVMIPAGSFMMGSTKAERDRYVKEGGSPKSADRELPRHRVALNYKLAVGKFPVTRGEFSAFIEESGYRPNEEICTTVEKIADSKEYIFDPHHNRSWNNPGILQDDSHPVACVNWDDITAYIKWLSKKTGENYRLLSEAEWEYAARAGTNTYRYWGDDKNNVRGCDYANVQDKTPYPSGKKRVEHFQCSDGYFGTSPVGSYKPNAFGLYDMAGNLWEWMADCFTDNHTGAPADGSARTVESCEEYILRGGSWISRPWYIHAAARNGTPHLERNVDTGFRIARTH
jgi:formylglycine-generating enzyme required for sulfatase activity